MSISLQTLTPFITRIRFPFSPLSSFLYSTINHEIVNNNNNDDDDNKIDESRVLKELSTLLPIKQSNFIPNSTLINCQSEIRARVRVSPDDFLQLDDRLRGVFLQKIKIKSLVENALDNALGDDDIDIDVISRVLNNGNLGGGAMVLFFNWVISKKDEFNAVAVYNVVLKALGRRKYFDFMVGMFEGMRGNDVRPDKETVRIVVDSFIRARRVNRALELVGKLGEFGVVFDMEVFNVVLRCLCKRSHVGVANSLMNSMKGKVGFDVVSYNVVIGGWARMGRVCEMEKCLKGMVNDGVSPNCETYSCLIEGLGRVGQVDNAVKIFKSMEGEGCRPDTGVYNAMITNYVLLGDFDECMKYYEEMCGNDCLPNLDTYTRLITGLLKARKVADALELFDVMLHRGVLPRTGTITSFIEPLCSYGPPHAAMMVYKSAKKAGCQISMKAYKLLLTRLSRFGKCGTILKLWNDMQECGYSSDMEVYECVINGLCNNGQLDLAVYVMEEALNKGFCPSRLMCTKLNSKLVAFNKTEIAYKLYQKIKKARTDENARRYWRANGWHF